MADRDSDGDGTVDYNDQCSNDPSKTNNCGGAGISGTTPTPSSTQKAGPNLLRSASVKMSRRLADQVFLPADRVLFSTKGPRSRTVRAKRRADTKGHY